MLQHLEVPSLIMDSSSSSSSGSSDVPPHQAPSSSSSYHPLQVVMVRPSMMATFDWSDFPIVQRDAWVMDETPCQMIPDGETQEASFPCFASSSNSSSSSNALDLISICSTDSDLTANTSCLSLNSKSSTSTSSTPNNNKPHRRRVSFSNTKHVRTHSIVLGDHPCCAQLALELGWEHNDGTTVEQQQPHHDIHTGIHAKNKLRRRSYFERKALLKEVGGLTEEDIRKTTLQHAAPSSHHLSTMQGIAL